MSSRLLKLRFLGVGSEALLPDGGHKTVSGLIAEARHEGADGGFSRFALSIVPGLTHLTHRTNSRVFQDQS